MRPVPDVSVTLVTAGQQIKGDISQSCCCSRYQAWSRWLVYEIVLELVICWVCSKITFHRRGPAEAALYLRVPPGLPSAGGWCGGGVWGAQHQQGVDVTCKRIFVICDQPLG